MCLGGMPRNRDSPHGSRHRWGRYRGLQAILRPRFSGPVAGSPRNGRLGQSRCDVVQGRYDPLQGLHEQCQGKHARPDVASETK